MNFHSYVYNLLYTLYKASKGLKRYAYSYTQAKVFLEIVFKRKHDVTIAIISYALHWFIGHIVNSNYVFDERMFKIKPLKNFIKLH